MNEVSESIKPVIRNLKHVKINHSAIESFSLGFRGLETSFRCPFSQVQLSFEDKIQLDLIYNSINFCYWPKPKWTIDYQNVRIGGAYGLKAAFNRAIQEGFPILDASYLENMPEGDFKEITRGDNKIPLIELRLNLLRKIGKALNEKYEGHAHKLVESGNMDAMKILHEVTRNMPGYNDFSVYEGKEVYFHKRAQLFVSNLPRILRKQGKTLSGVEELTALADYKVPQMLRTLGILEYDDALASNIDDKIVLPLGSREEIEIRASTIEAVRLMADKLSGKFPTVNPLTLDKFLYLESKKDPFAHKPYHRTLTSAY